MSVVLSITKRGRTRACIVTAVIETHTRKYVCFGRCYRCSRGSKISKTLSDRGLTRKETENTTVFFACKRVFLRCKKITVAVSSPNADDSSFGRMKRRKVRRYYTVSIEPLRRGGDRNDDCTFDPFIRSRHVEYYCGFFLPRRRFTGGLHP